MTSVPTQPVAQPPDTVPLQTSTGPGACQRRVFHGSTPAVHEPVAALPVSAA